MINAKKALILGVGAAQLDAIRYLKHHDWWVIGCSYRQEGLGIEWLDQFELIDISDIGRIESLARKEKIDLIYSVGSDLAMLPVAVVARNLGLPALLTPETAYITQDKIRLRRFLDANKISPVRWMDLSLQKAVEGWGIYPAVIKPSDSQGQRGVYRVDCAADLKRLLPEATAHSAGGAAIIEEYLDGPEVSANVFLRDGQVMVNVVSERRVLTDFPGGIPESHLLSAQQNSADYAGVRKMVGLAAAALGVTDGPLYFQLKRTSNGPRIIEIAPRLDGCHLWRLVKTAAGIDLLDMVFNALQKKAISSPGIEKRGRDYLLAFFFQPPGAIFHSREFRIPADADFYEFYYRDGDVVRPVNGWMEKVGYYIQGC